MVLLSAGRNDQIPRTREKEVAGSPSAASGVVVSTLIPEGYAPFIKHLKARIQATQVRAALAVSQELTSLYWDLGHELEQATITHAWGSKVLERIAADLKAAFPGVEGFSRRNLYRMRAFYLAYRDDSLFVPQAVAQIPWGHNAVLLSKLTTAEERLWYAQKTSKHGWSRSILELQIESKLFERHGRALTNFAQTLPPPQSDPAQHILKDPYNFDFLYWGGRLPHDRCATGRPKA